MNLTSPAKTCMDGGYKWQRIHRRDRRWHVRDWWPQLSRIIL